MRQVAVAERLCGEDPRVVEESGLITASQRRAEAGRVDRDDRQQPDRERNHDRLADRREAWARPTEAQDHEDQHHADEQDRDDYARSCVGGRNRHGSVEGRRSRTGTCRRRAITR